MRVLIGVGAAMILVLAGTGPVSAACSSGVTSFAAVAEEAERIVIGTVTDAEPEPPSRYASVFDVTIEHTVRGPAASVVKVNNLVTNPPCGTVLLARDGDRIALALGGYDFHPRLKTNALAYLDGVPHRPDIERVTVHDVYRLADVVPDTAVAPASAVRHLGLALLAAAAMAATDIKRQRHRFT